MWQKSFAILTSKHDTADRVLLVPDSMKIVAHQIGPVCVLQEARQIEPSQVPILQKVSETLALGHMRLERTEEGIVKERPYEPRRERSNVSRSVLNKDTMFSVSSLLPPRSGAPGYSLFDCQYG